MTISSSSSAPLFVVVGSTGNQGGGVVKALQASSTQFRVRGLTRDPSKAAAKALEKEGVEVVGCEVAVGKEAEVGKAFEGAKFVFLVTNFWQHVDMKREIAEGKLMIDAAKSAGAHVVWSGLPSYDEISSGKYVTVDHFEGKFQVTQYAKQQGVPIVVVEPAFYLSNFIDFGLIRKQEDGSYAAMTSLKRDSNMQLIDAEDDYGLFVVAAAESGLKNGESVQAYSLEATMGTVFDAIQKHTGKQLPFVQATDEQVEQGAAASGMPPRVAKEIAEMFAVQREYGYYGGRKGSEVKLPRPPTTLDAWIQKQDWSKLFK